MTEEQRAIAAEARGHFEYAKRVDGSEYWRRKDGAPDWIEEMSREAGHDGGVLFPDDYRYQFLVDSLDAIGESPDEDETEEYLPEEVYTSALTEWLNSAAWRVAYMSDVLEEFGGVAEPDGFQQLMVAYRFEQREVLQAVLSWLGERAEENVRVG